MLGRYQVPGCCPGTRAGRDPGPDCGAGGPMDVRRAKRIEARGTAREIATGLEDYQVDDETDPTWDEALAGLRRAEPVEVVRPSECAECLRYWGSQPYLSAACASVGIEHGKSTFQIVSEYLAAYHERGHREG